MSQSEFLAVVKRDKLCTRVQALTYFINAKHPTIAGLKRWLAL